MALTLSGLGFSGRRRTGGGLLEPPLKIFCCNEPIFVKFLPDIVMNVLYLHMIFCPLSITIVRDIGQ